MTFQFWARAPAGDGVARATSGQSILLPARRGCRCLRRKKKGKVARVVTRTSVGTRYTRRKARTGAVIVAILVLWVARDAIFPQCSWAATGPKAAAAAPANARAIDGAAFPVS